MNNTINNLEKREVKDKRYYQSKLLETNWKTISDIIVIISYWVFQEKRAATILYLMWILIFGFVIYSFVVWDSDLKIYAVNCIVLFWLILISFITLCKGVDRSKPTYAKLLEFLNKSVWIDTTPKSYDAIRHNNTLIWSLKPRATSLALLEVYTWKNEEWKNKLNTFLNKKSDFIQQDLWEYRMLDGVTAWNYYWIALNITEETDIAKIQELIEAVKEYY